MFKYAVGKGYLVEENDAIRNRKEGLYYEVLRYFDEERLRTKMYAEERRTMREAKLEKVSSDEKNEILENKKYTKGTKIREYAIYKKQRNNRRLPQENETDTTNGLRLSKL